MLCRGQFGLSHPVQTLKRGLLNIDVLADNLGSDTCVAQSQRERVRQG